MGRSMARAWCRRAAAMLWWPSSRSRVIAVLRRPLHHAFVRSCLGIELPHPRYGELFRLG